MMGCVGQWGGVWFPIERLCVCVCVAGEAWPCGMTIVQRLETRKALFFITS